MIIFIGVSGAGKGTQSELLIKNHGCVHLSTGEMLRESATAEQQARMLEGRWLDDEEIIEMVDQKLQTLSAPDKVILDGFPRSLEQAKWLLSHQTKDHYRITAIFNLVASLDTLRERLKARGRIDDTDEAIELRFNEYSRSTHPIIDFFKQYKLPVYDIDGSKSPELVHEDIMKYLTDKEADNSDC